MPKELWPDPDALDRYLLSGRWERARPFAHVIVDDWLGPAAREALMGALADEPANRIVSEIYEVMATGEPTTATLRDFTAHLGSPAMLEAVSAIVGGSIGRVTLRGYAYGPGHFLLPHHDRDRDATRTVAFAIYVAATDDLLGGELELFDCERQQDRIVATTSASLIEPRPGRLVLFDVSDDSLHQVREVTAGLRTSLAGWFYR
jgi:hypothetical protein